MNRFSILSCLLLMTGLISSPQAIGSGNNSDYEARMDLLRNMQIAIDSKDFFVALNTCHQHPDVRRWIHLYCRAEVEAAFRTRNSPQSAREAWTAYSIDTNALDSKPMETRAIDRLWETNPESAAGASLNAMRFESKSID